MEGPKSNLTTTDMVQELQKKLYQKAKSNANFRFYALYDKVYVAQRIRKFMRRHRGKVGYGYKQYPATFLYQKLGLYNDYRVSRGRKPFEELLPESRVRENLTHGLMRGRWERD